jgi:hypothetical protein
MLVVYIYLYGILLRTSHIPHKQALGYITTQRVQDILEMRNANRSMAGSVRLKRGG